MDRHGFAVWALVAGLVIGLVGNLLFYGKEIGLSFPLFVLLLVGAVLLSARVKGASLRWRNLWLLLPLLFFAGMIAVLASPSLLMSNGLAVLALGALGLFYLTSERHVDTDGAMTYLTGVFEASLSTFIVPFFTLADGWGWLRQRGRRRPTALGAVLRGLLLAIPLLLIFALLLSSADAVFGEFLSRFWNLFYIENLEDLIGQGSLVVLLGWAACGAIVYGVTRDSRMSVPEPTGADPFMPETDAPQVTLAQPAAPMGGWKLGLIESGIVLGSVNLLFGTFVLVQFAYFFGGQTNISVEGLTYAEYARRGFFELVTVAVIVLGLALLLDSITVRTSPTQHTLFRVLAIVLIGLTTIMLVSAWQRMSLYESEYGFTHLRLYTHLFMLWMGVLFIFFLLSLFRVREHIFSLGILVFLIGYLVTLNVVNPDYTIARLNVERYRAGHTLDFVHLNTLSPDMIPVLVPLYVATSESDPQAHRCAAQVLSDHLQRLDSLRESAGGTWFSANLSRDGAWALLDPIRDELPDYRWDSLYNEDCGGSDYSRDWPD